MWRMIAEARVSLEVKSARLADAITRTLYIIIPLPSARRRGLLRFEEYHVSRARFRYSGREECRIRRRCALCATSLFSFAKACRLFIENR